MTTSLPYIPVEGIPPGRSTTYVIQEMTYGKPWLFDVAHKRRSGGELYIVLRRKTPKK